MSNPATQDCNIIYAVQRQTADGTATSVTPVFVPAMRGRDATVPGLGVEGQLHGRGHLCWQAVDKVPEPALGLHLVLLPMKLALPWPAVNLNGVACMAKGATSDYTGTVAWEVKFDE